MFWDIGGIWVLRMVCQSGGRMGREDMDWYCRSKWGESSVSEGTQRRMRRRTSRMTQREGKDLLRCSNWDMEYDMEYGPAWSP